MTVPVIALSCFVRLSSRNGVENPAAGDLGPEAIESYSVIGRHYIFQGSDFSGTTTVYELSFD